MASMVTILTPNRARVMIGKDGRRFNAPRIPDGFTASPPATQGQSNSGDKWFDLPTPTGPPPFHLELAAVLGPEAIAKIAAKKRLVFHAVGDTGGVNTTTYQQRVATFMELDFTDADTEGANPSFFYHLGDVVYYDGEVGNYYREFYEPYMHYPAPIFAIPGNHDGDMHPRAGLPVRAESLKGFVRNFCSAAPAQLAEAEDAPRTAMTQPNVYWTLETSVATIIGLYTNVASGGRLSADQIAWFSQELASAPKDRALILALHHPLYSAYGQYPGSSYLKSIVVQCAKAVNRTPDLILSGHVHNYQRFEGHVNGRTIACIVAGAGGYNQKLHTLDRTLFDPNAVPYRFNNAPDTLEKFNDFQHGYLVIDVREDKIIGRYMAIDEPGFGDAVPTKPTKPYDEFEILLQHSKGLSNERS
jgi:acid phosphatase type 7